MSQRTWSSVFMLVFLGALSARCADDSGDKLVGVWKTKEKFAGYDVRTTIRKDGGQWSIKGAYEKDGNVAGTFVGEKVKVIDGSLTYWFKHVKKPDGTWQDHETTVRLNSEGLVMSWVAKNGREIERACERVPEAKETAKTPAKESAKPKPSGRAISLGERIVQFCRENEGKEVGAGNCYALAAKALNAAGARPRSLNADYPEKEDYVWGKLVMYHEATETGLKREGKYKDIQLGDVIQFRDTTFEGNRPNGKGKYTVTAPHHTAIVYAVENDGKVVKIYQQNDRGKKFVTEGSLILDDLKKGWIRVYRPIPKG
jgi:hypothetical protein